MRTSDNPGDETPQGGPSDNVQVLRHPAALNGRLVDFCLPRWYRSLTFLFVFAFAGMAQTSIETVGGEPCIAHAIRKAVAQVVASEAA